MPLLRSATALLLPALLLLVPGCAKPPPEPPPRPEPLLPAESNCPDGPRIRLANQPRENGESRSTLAGDIVLLFFRDRLAALGAAVAEDAVREMRLTVLDVSYPLGPTRIVSSGRVKLILAIPETGYSRIFEATSQSPLGSNMAVALAVDAIFQECLEDPEVLSFLLCR